MSEPEERVEIKFESSRFRIRFNEVHIDPTNPRHQRNPDADEKLEKLMRTHGDYDRFKICVRKGGDYLLLDGHRRYDIYVKWGFKDENPIITCDLIYPVDDNDRIMDDHERRKWRLLHREGMEDLTDYDHYMDAILFIKEEKERGRPYYQTAKDFDWEYNWFKKIDSILSDSCLHEALKSGVEAYYLAELLRIPVEAQKSLIDAKGDLNMKQVRDAVKLVKEGTEIASAIESVTHPQEEAEQLAETPQDGQEEKEGDGEITVDDGGDSSAKEDESGNGKPPTPSPETPKGSSDIISDVMGKGAGGEVAEEKIGSEKTPVPGTSDQPPPKDVEPAEKKKTQPPDCAFAKRVKSFYQERAKLGPKRLVDKFRVDTHRSAFMGDTRDSMKWHGIVLDMMSSHMNGDCETVCQVIRTFVDMKDAIQSARNSQHSMKDKDKEKYDSILHQLKTEIEKGHDTQEMM